MFKSCLTAVLGTVILGAAAGTAAKDPATTTAADAATSAVTLPPDESVSPAARARAAAAAARGPDMSKIEEVRHADGSTEWVFNGQAEETMTLVHDEHGKPGVRCSGLGVTHTHQAAAAEASNER